MCGSISRVAWRTAVEATDNADDGEPNSGGDATPTATATALSVSAPPEPRPDPRLAALAGVSMPTGAHWVASLGATGGSCRSAAVGPTDVRIGRHSIEMCSHSSRASEGTGSVQPDMHRRSASADADR